MKAELRALKKNASEQKRANQLMVSRIKRKKPTDLDNTINKLHKQVFKETDCTQCANCCKKGSPSFSFTDIKRLAGHLGITNKAFRKKYLMKADDGDLMFSKTPCVFLGKDNRCTVYEARPANCRQYPHTQRSDYFRNLELGIDNTFLCPAVLRIYERMREVY